MIFNFRYKRFEKAFLLAVDIGAKDLFMVSCCPIFIIFFTGIAYKAENASFHCSTIKTFYLCRLLTKSMLSFIKEQDVSFIYTIKSSQTQIIYVQRQ